MIPPVAIGIAAVVIAGGAFTAGWKVNNWRHDSQKLAIQEAAMEAGKAATDASVAAIKTLTPKFTTIRQETIRETRVEPRYLDPGCNHTDAVWLRLQAAYEAAGGQGSSGTGVPATPVPSR